MSLPFTWEPFEDTYIIADNRGHGCHPANSYEKMMIKEIERLRRLLAKKHELGIKEKNEHD